LLVVLVVLVLVGHVGGCGGGGCGGGGLLGVVCLSGVCFVYGVASVCRSMGFCFSVSFWFRPRWDFDVVFCFVGYGSFSDVLLIKSAGDWACRAGKQSGRNRRRWWTVVTPAIPDDGGNRQGDGATLLVGYQAQLLWVRVPHCGS